MRPLIYVLLATLLTTAVAAIGIAPALTEIMPGGDQNITFRVYSDPGTVSLEVNGSLAEYIELERNSLVFSDERVQTVVATIRATDDVQEGLFADISAIGDTRVSARIVLKRVIETPTGNVVLNSDFESSHWVSMALIILVIGNVIYFTVAKNRRKRAIDLKRVKTIAELADTVRTMSETLFRKYVNDDKNEFADWLGEHGYPELAYRLYDIMDKATTIGVLESYEPMGPGSEQEILELRRELETFDFSGFDKIYK
jgi:hypothetical protein